MQIEPLPQSMIETGREVLVTFQHAVTFGISKRVGDANWVLHKGQDKVEITELQAAAIIALAITGGFSDHEGTPDAAILDPTILDKQLYALAEPVMAKLPPESRIIP